MSRTHWDVSDFGKVLEEAWELVEQACSTPEGFATSVLEWF